MPHHARETEWQFDALDLGPVLRWLDESAARAAGGAVRVVPRRTVNQVDVYLDTNDLRFHRAGYALRVRRTGRRRDQTEATLNSLQSNQSKRPGLRSLRELSEQLERGSPDDLAHASGSVGERVRALAGARDLGSLFEVRTRRRAFSLDYDGLAVGEIALDETSIRSEAGRTVARLRRVEVEVPEQAVDALEPFVEELRTACGLQPAGLSKYEAGLIATGPHPSTLIAFGPTAIDPEAPIGVVALAVLRRHFSVLLAKEPGTRLGDDIEELHDMRVASRRLRAALRLFQDVLPVDAPKLRQELEWLARALGAVRDLDVQLQQLDHWIAAVPEADREPLARLRLLLTEQRTEARAAMLEVLDSRRYATFVRRFGRMLRMKRGGRSRLARAPARAVAPDLIERSLRPTRRAAKRIDSKSPPSDYHRLRIACKRFRYALEFLADVYPGETRRLTRRVVVLQDILGLNQDADVAIGRLRQLAAERGGELGSETVFAMGEIAERYRRDMEELQARFPAAYDRLDGKALKTFRTHIAELRPVPPAPSPPTSTAEPEPATR